MKVSETLSVAMRSGIPLSRSQSEARLRDGLSHERFRERLMRLSGESLSQQKSHVMVWSILIEKQHWMRACRKRRAERNPWDSAWNDPGRRPKVGPLHCQRISQAITVSHPQEPRLSWASPSDSSVNLIDSLAERNLFGGAFEVF
jgi:hypothetical protein